MLQPSEQNLSVKINQEISKSFLSVNYSQWERQAKQSDKKLGKTFFIYLRQI